MKKTGEVAGVSPALNQQGLCATEPTHTWNWTRRGVTRASMPAHSPITLALLLLL